MCAIAPSGGTCLSRPFSGRKGPGRPANEAIAQRAGCPAHPACGQSPVRSRQRRPDQRLILERSTHARYSLAVKICIYTTTALPKIGGQELVVDALAREFQCLGHEVRVLAPNPRRRMPLDDQRLPYTVVRHPRYISTRYLVPWYRRYVLRLARQWPFDVVHCHGLYPAGFVAGLCRQQLGVPLVVTSHGDEVFRDAPRLQKPLIRRRVVSALHAADSRVAISPFTEEGYSWLAPDAQPVVRIPNGVHLEPFQKLAARAPDLPDNVQPGRYCLFLGRLHRRKGLDTLIDALALLPPDRRPLIVVAGQGDERDALVAQASQRHVEDWFHFAGPVAGEKKTWLLQHAMLLVVPSRDWEAFPLVVLEAFAAGLPVLGTAIPGLRDVVQHDQTGCLVEPESPDALARALAELSHDPTRRSRLGQRARQIAEEHSWRAIAERHLRLFADLRLRRRPGRVA